MTDNIARLDAMIAEARREALKDEEHWMLLGWAQDIEEAGESGYLLGYLDGLKDARAALVGSAVS